MQTEAGHRLFRKKKQTEAGHPLFRRKKQLGGVPGMEASASAATGIFDNDACLLDDCHDKILLLRICRMLLAMTQLR